MDIGIYISSTEQLKDILSQDIPAKWILFGDYNCYKRIPNINELRDIAHDSKLNFHYISPKVNMARMDYEYNNVLELLDQGISVSINDLGLLYKLKQAKNKNASIYLGRLLTKSINRWIWGEIHVAQEDPEAKSYFAQNNFYQQEKMEYFKDWNIKGIETSIFSKEEESLKKIKEENFEIIGFIDNTIAAVSRACPIAKDKGITVANYNCSHLCLNKEIIIRPANHEQMEKYPDLYFEGTVLMKRIEPTLSWTGYDKVIFSYINEASLPLIKNLLEV